MRRTAFFTLLFGYACCASQRYTFQVVECYSCSICHDSMLPMRNLSLVTHYHLLIKSLILIGLVLFGFFIVAERGWLTTALSSDRSYISYVILLLYGILSLHWLLLVKQLAADTQVIDKLQSRITQLGPGDVTLSAEGLNIQGQTVTPGICADYLQELVQKSQRRVTAELDHNLLLEVLAERLMSRYTFGHWAADMLLKLGLLGTILGFIMMLSPVGELTDFDPNVLQQLLGQMSGGMAVALYTTMAGLITSTLLGLQYEMLDTAASRLVDKLAIAVDIYILPTLSRPAI